MGDGEGWTQVQGLVGDRMTPLQRRVNSFIDSEVGGPMTATTRWQT